MKKFLVTTVVALCLVGCATGPSSYGPVSAESSLGFETTKIENDRFRISYTARDGQEAQDFALLRAAEVAQAEGFSHFKIIGGALEDNGPRSPVSTSIGFGTGRFYGRSRSNVGFGVNIGDLGRALQGDRITNMIEVRLLNRASDDPDIYDAAGIIENIRPEVFK